MKKRMAIFRRKAFTLIELLVVIAIISLLVSILLPSLQKAKELAKSAVCMSSLHNLYSAFTMYATDNNGYVVQGNQVSPTGTTTYWKIWKDDLFPYTGENKLAYKCAADEHFCPTDDVWGPIYGWNRKAWATISYGYNVTSVGWFSNSSSGWCHEKYTLSEFTDLEKTVVFADSYGFATRTHPDWPYQPHIIRIWSYLMDPRHLENANLVFMDGSVRSWPSEYEFSFRDFPGELR